MRIEVGTSLEVGSVAVTAQDWLQRLNREGADVELDLSQVQRLDSAGMQLILSLAREVQGRNGSFCLAGVTETVDRVRSRMGIKAAILRGSE